jgi:ATP-dependent DNA ligase
MLAKLGDKIPVGGYLYEPKWDGFRAIVFRQEDEVYIQSRDARPLDRYFPELHDALLQRLPKNCVVDGEIVIATTRGNVNLQGSGGFPGPGGAAGLNRRSGR